MNSFEKLRSQLPIFAERVYLATHCLGPLPKTALDELEEYKNTLFLGSRAIEHWIERVVEIHALVESFLGAPPNSVALLANATACQAALAAALSPTPARNRIFTTSLDFHSARYLWRAQERRGFEVIEFSSPDGVSFPEEELLSALDERVAVVAVSLASYASGAMLDAARLVERAHAAGALVILDVYQAAGIVPLDVTALGVDAVAGGTHKWLHGGAPGLAFLYVRPELAERLQPAYPGWLGHERLDAYTPEFTPGQGARRFGQGTPPIEPLYTGRAGLRLLMEVGVAALRERSIALTSRMIKTADALGLRLRTPRAASARSGMLCFAAKDPAAVVKALAARRFDVDTRPNVGIRVSPHPCLAEEECDLFLQNLAEILEKEVTTIAPARPQTPPRGGKDEFLREARALLKNALSSEEERVSPLSEDFGHLSSQKPLAILRPSTSEDIAQLIRLAGKYRVPVAARGQGHTTGGQSLSEGVVIEMASLASIGEISEEGVWVGAGCRWLDLVRATLAHGLIPPVLTGFLEMSIGGTLSVGGLGERSFAFGAQTDNVLELEVITGTGERVFCSREKNSDLFDACRAGLGQFGVIAGARLKLLRVSPKVITYEMLYDDIPAFLLEQQRQMQRGAFDNIGAMVVPTPKGWGFLLQLSIYCAEDRPLNEDALLAGVALPPGGYTRQERSSLEFLERLSREAEQLKAAGIWEIPHPWSTFFLTSERAAEFLAQIVGRITNEDIGNGYIAIYPVQRERLKTPFLRAPAAAEGFLMGVLPNVLPPTKERTEYVLGIVRWLFEEAKRLGGVMYPVGVLPPSEVWPAHFQDAWEGWCAAKRRFDPHRILSPGYQIPYPE